MSGRSGWSGRSMGEVGWWWSYSGNDASRQSHRPRRRGIWRRCLASCGTGWQRLHGLFGVGGWKWRLPRRRRAGRELRSHACVCGRCVWGRRLSAAGCGSRQVLRAGVWRGHRRGAARRRWPWGGHGGPLRWAAGLAGTSSPGGRVSCRLAVMQCTWAAVATRL